MIKRLLCLVLILTILHSITSLASVTYLMSADFNLDSVGATAVSGISGSIINVDNGFGAKESSNHILKVEGVSGNSVNFTPTATTGNFTIEFSVFIDDYTGSKVFETVEATKGIFANIVTFSSDGKIYTGYSDANGRNNYAGAYELGKWYRVGYTVYSGTQSFDLYINGTKIDTSGLIAANEKTTGTFDKTSRIKFSYSGNSEKSLLYIDDIYCYNDIYSNTAAVSTLNSSVYDIADGAISMNSFPTVAEFAQNINCSGSVAVYKNRACSAKLNSSESLTDISYVIETAADGVTYHTYEVSKKELSAYWNFDELTNGVAEDKTGNGYNGILVNTPTLAAGKSGNAISFSADGQAVRVNNSANNFVYNTNDEYSISMWVKPATLDSSWRGILVKGRAQASSPTATKNNYYGIWTTDANKIGYSGNSNGTGINVFAAAASSINTWYYITSVQRGGMVYLYINGALQSSAAAKDIINTGDEMFIGAVHSGFGRQFFKGMVDDAAIFNYALSADEISSIYSGTSPMEISPSAVTIYSELTSLLQELNTININDYTIISYNNLKAVMEEAENVFFLESDPYHTAIAVENIIAKLYEAKNALIIQPKAVAYWNFDELTNGVAEDKTGNGYNGILVNTPALAAGKSGNAISFSADGQAVRVNNSANNFVYNTNDEYSISMWVKPATLDSSWRGILIKGRAQATTPTATKNNYYGIWTTDANKIGYSGNSNGTGINVFAAAASSINTWYYISSVQRGGMVYFYINGALQSSASAKDINNTGDEMFIGAVHSGFGRQFFKGMVDDAAIFNYALSADEISSIYSGTSLVDISAAKVTQSMAEYLSEIITKAQGIENNNYTTKSWSTLQSAITEAVLAADNPQSLEQVENLIAELETAMETLEEKTMVTQIGFSDNSLKWELADDSGNGHTGAVFGNPEFVAGKNGQAICFNTDGQAVEIADSDEFNFKATDSYSISMWVSPQTLTSLWQGILVKGRAVGTTAYDNYYGLWLTGGNAFSYSAAGNVIPSITSSIVPEVNSWYNLVLKQDGATQTVYFYINGMLIGVKTSATFDTAGRNMYIGAVNSGFGRQFFKGIIDDVCIYNEAISDSAILSLYSGAVPDSVSSDIIAYWSFDSAANYVVDDVAVIGEAAFAQGLKNNALVTGNSNKLTISSSNAIDLYNSDYSAALLIKADNISNIIISEESLFKIYTDENGVLKVNDNTTGVTLNSDTWYHIAFVNDVTENSFKLYLNNVKAAEFAAINCASDKLEVAYAGLLESITIYNYALNSEELEKVYKDDCYSVDTNTWYVPSQEPVKLIYDTDFGGDIDDAGAIAIINDYIQQGRAQLLAVIVVRDLFTAASGIDALNTYYGNPDVPIGVANGKTSTGAGNYAKYLTQNYENDMYHAVNAWDGTKLYRKTLAEAEDNSVVVVITGEATNFYRLLTSQADEYSNLSGIDLVAKKVRLVSFMAGQFPQATLLERNFTYDLKGTQYMVENCPVKILFSGFEVGNVYWTGGKLPQLGGQHPLKKAYDEYFAGNNSTATTRASYDQTSVVAAVEGISDYWDIKLGKCIAPDSGYSSFEENGYGDHAYLVVKKDINQMTSYLDELMMNAKHDNPDEKKAENIDDALLTLSGTFTQNTSTSAMYNNTYASSGNAGDYMQYTFNGTGVAVYGQMAADCGIAQIYIDGELYGNADLYYESKLMTTRVFEAMNLEEGEHTIKIVVKDEKNSSSAGKNVTIDYLRVYSDYTIDIEESEGTLTATAFSVARNSNIYLAQYDDGGRLLKVDMSGDISYGDLVLNTEKNGNTKIVKAFYFNNNLSPHTKSATR